MPAPALGAEEHDVVELEGLLVGGPGAVVVGGAEEFVDGEEAARSQRAAQAAEEGDAGVGVEVVEELHTHTRCDGTYGDATTRRGMIMQLSLLKLRRTLAFFKTCGDILRSCRNSSTIRWMAKL